MSHSTFVSSQAKHSLNEAVAHRLCLNDGWVLVKFGNHQDKRPHGNSLTGAGGGMFVLRRADVVICEL